MVFASKKGMQSYMPHIIRVLHILLALAVSGKLLLCRYMYNETCIKQIAKHRNHCQPKHHYIICS